MGTPQFLEEMKIFITKKFNDLEKKVSFRSFLDAELEDQFSYIWNEVQIEIDTKEETIFGEEVSQKLSKIIDVQK